jgi:hypothetical protein
MDYYNSKKVTIRQHGAAITSRIKADIPSRIPGKVRLPMGQIASIGNISFSGLFCTARSNARITTRSYTVTEV